MTSLTLKNRPYIALDTETTGLSYEDGDRIIEIGCVKINNFFEFDDQDNSNVQYFHEYLHTDREINKKATEIHGITNSMLIGKPDFSEVAHKFLNFIHGAILIIHNAKFDIGFLNNELTLLGIPQDHQLKSVDVLDTLPLARKLFPGANNSLDGLCKRFGISLEKRTLHGALLDAKLLGQVFLCLQDKQKIQQALRFYETTVKIQEKKKEQMQFKEATLSGQEKDAHINFIKTKINSSVWYT